MHVAKKVESLYKFIGMFSYDGGDFGTVGVPREHQAPDGFACVGQSDGTTRICVEKAERLRTARLLSC